MIGRVVLAALVAGLLSGLVLSGIQYVRLTPLIFAAEVFEHADEHAGPAAATAEASSGENKPACVENMPGMKMCPDPGEQPAWEPAPGAERLTYTTVASMLTGAGFALVLAAISLFSGVPITRANGLIWGLCGFLAVHVATGAGLPPQVPGTPVADLLARQVWWVGTIIATAAGIYLIALRRETWAPFVAVVLMALPHIIGAPQPPNAATSVPPQLAAAFVANATAAAAVFWAILGLLLGVLLPRALHTVEAKA
ncbi:MAG: CbtA family protein [Hyphomicrobiales bacterium]